MIKNSALNLLKCIYHKIFHISVVFYCLTFVVFRNVALISSVYSGKDIVLMHLSACA